MEVNIYLEEVFGENISMQQFEDTNHFPKYLLDNYDFYQCIIQEKNYTFLFVKENKFIISQLKKQLNKLQSLNIKYPVLIINHTRREIRNKLIANRIPFIDVNKQMYIPYISLSIDESCRMDKKEVYHFTPSTQFIFIAILMQDDAHINSAQLRNKYHLNAMTLSRALRDLTNIGLLNEYGYNTRKKYQRIDRNEFWHKGKSFMINPIQKRLYVNQILENNEMLLSSDSALAYSTMLNEPSLETYAIYKSKENFISQEKRIDEEIALNEKCIQVELWNYDPYLLSQDKKSIDIFSLYAIYQNSDDPRVEIELEELLERKFV